MATELIPDPRVVPPGVPYRTFISSIWTTTGLATIFLLLRLYYSHWLVNKRRLYLDDYFILLSVSIVLVTAALWQWAAPSMYAFLNAADAHGGADDLPADFPEQLERFLVVWGVIQMLYAASLTAVKISLLVFFRRVGGHMSRLRFVWWPVLFFTLATWAAMTGLVHYRCVFTSLGEIFAYCSTDDSIRFTTASLIAGCSLDVISDFLIMIIPVVLLWGVQIPPKQKFIFIGLIFLTLVTVAISIARAADGFATHWSTSQDDISYLCLWTAVEPCAAIIVACLSAFPQLFVPSSSSRPVYTSGEVAWVDHQYTRAGEDRGAGGKRSSKSNKILGTSTCGAGGGGVGRINVSVSYGHQISRISQEPMEEGDDKNSTSDDIGYTIHGANSRSRYHNSKGSKSQESQLPMMGWESPVPPPGKTVTAVTGPARAAAGLYTRTRTSVNGKALL